MKIYIYIYIISPLSTYIYLILSTVKQQFQTHWRPPCAFLLIIELRVVQCPQAVKRPWLLVKVCSLRSTLELLLDIRACFIKLVLASLRSVYEQILSICITTCKFFVQSTQISSFTGKYCRYPRSDFCPLERTGWCSPETVRLQKAADSHSAQYKVSLGICVI